MKPYTEEQQNIIEYIVDIEETGKDLGELVSITVQDFNDLIQKKINQFILPIKFTDYAIVLFDVLCKTNIEAKIMLIDCMDKFNHRLVTARDIIKTLYPYGFYSRKEIEDRLKVISANHMIGWNRIY